MELLDRFWPASRQLAKRGPVRFGPDLSQSGSRRIEACPGDRSDAFPGESQWWKFCLSKKNNIPFLTICVIAIKTKSKLIFPQYFVVMITACPSSFLLRPLSVSWQSTSTIISRLRTHWQTKCCDHVCCQMLQIRPVSEVNRHGRSSDGCQTIRNYWF